MLPHVGEAVTQKSLVATRIAYRELVLWMARDYGFDKWDAHMMLSQCGKVRLGNCVDPKYTVGAAISKKYLAEKG